MLAIEGLSVRYGGVSALRDVSFRIEAGTISCLLGSNGAGKTTLLNAVMGVADQQAGKLVWEGKPIERLPTEKIVSSGIALVPEGRQLFGDLTVGENLRMGAFLRRDVSPKDYDEIFDLFPRLAERRSQLAKTLSGGEQQMVAIGRALMSKPRLLLLDEPSLGLAPILVREVMRLITTIHARGVTVFVVEQNARQALAISSVAHVLEKGRLVASGLAADIANNPAVRTAYLGANAH
jgi:branched-chain amino acid transport system ATP-binding protein